MADTTRQHDATRDAAPGAEPESGGFSVLVGHEVSCRGLGFFFRKVEGEGGSAEALLDGISYPRSHLCDNRARIDWASMCRLVCNFARGRTDDDLVAVGRGLAGSRWILPFAAVGRLLFTSAETTFNELRRVHTDVPVVLSSGYGLQDGSRWAQGKTRVAFLAKPYSVESMQETFHELLEGAAAVGATHGPGGAVGERMPS